MCATGSASVLLSIRNMHWQSQWHTVQNQMVDEKQQPDTTPIDVSYAGASGLESSDGLSKLKLFGNIARDPVQLSGRLRDPLRLREALSAVHAIVGSDYRYVPKDRSAYQAYRRMKNESAGMNAWQAQQQYFDWLMRNDPTAWLILDPIISVHPDQVVFEVFSKDEGAYAKLGVDLKAFDVEGAPVFGTTNIDFSESLVAGINQMRSYRQTILSIGQKAVEVETNGGDTVLEKQINVPDSWIRGFLQVQSAATLPSESFCLAPIDMYNVLRQLRLHADQKGKRRGLRIELVPGEYPRLVLEPWEIVIETATEKYAGRMAKIIRVWGRRRLMLMRRLLPFVSRIDVHVLGSGLPSFWVLRAGAFHLTLGLTGFTSSNWSQAVSFDLLLPRKTQSSEPLERVVKHLSTKWLDDEAGISAATGLCGEALLEALQTGCQQGQLMFDIACGVYRLRPLTDEPLDLEKLEYRNVRERIAHGLLHRGDAVVIESENRIFGTGLELTGNVDVVEDRREYRPQILIAEEGHVTKAECTCSFFRKQGLKAGPCEHLIALRLAYAKREAELEQSGDARETATVETRTYSKRTGESENVCQLTLDRKRVKIRWGEAGTNLRLQTLQYNSSDEARDAYFSRVDELETSGFLDATSG